MSRNDSLWSNGSNVTSSETAGPLKLATTVLMTTSLVLVMVGVGCSIEIKKLLDHLKRPYGVLIGILCQLVVLPLVTFGYAHALQLPPLQAIGMLIMSCCPGGATSNLFSMYVDGDVPLSLTMTCVNTVLSAGALPLNLYIYARSWTMKAAVIPYSNLAQGFAMMFIPAALGIASRHWKPKIASYLIQVGSVAGAFSILISMILVSLLHPYMYNASWRIYFAVVTVPFISYSFGYITAFLFRMPHFRCRTVALETGIQNYPFCITLLTLTFSKSEMGQLAIYPLLFGVFTLVDATVFTLLYKLCDKLQKILVSRVTESVPDTAVNAKLVEVKL